MSFQGSPDLSETEAASLEAKQKLWTNCSTSKLGVLVSQSIPGGGEGGGEEGVANRILSEGKESKVGEKPLFVGERNR